MIVVKYQELQSVVEELLGQFGFQRQDAVICAEIFAENTAAGVSSHGINRFPFFIELVKSGDVIPTAKPTIENAYNALEQWNGNLGPGPSNALFISQRTNELAEKYGIGCVALKNTNHWLRPGYYASKVADRGFIFICWTNTIPNMPPWGAKTPTTGNNPIVLGVPRKEGNIVVDMALSQYSYGTLANYRRENKELPSWGGYDENGNLTKNAKDIVETQRPLPIGYWKGAGLSLLLDLIATVLSGGKSTFELREKGIDTGMSQIFISIDPSRFSADNIIERTVNEILEYYLSAEKAGEADISYPGQRIINAKKKNLKNGIAINEKIWQKVLDLRNQGQKR